MAEAIQLYKPTDVLAERSTFDVMPMAFALAEKLAQTEFVPVALRMKPAAVAACILYGHEVGMPPMASLQHINVIQGRPGLSAAGQRALILANGHRIWIEEATITRATVCSQRRGEERISSTTWTMDDADRASLKNKDNWRAYPRNMLIARATGDNARGNFMDVLVGLPYNVEELEDLVDPDQLASGDASSPATPPAPGTVRRRARRAATAPAALSAPASEPPPSPDPAAEQEPQATPAASEPPPAPSAEPVPAPSAAQPVEPAGEKLVDPSHVAAMSLAQQVAMVCREANIDRAALIDAVTGKKQARDLTRPEAADVLDKAKALARGEFRLVQDEGRWVLLPPEPVATPSEDPGAAFRN
jgi:hypothetical protein